MKTRAFYVCPPDGDQEPYISMKIQCMEGSDYNY